MIKSKHIIGTITGNNFFPRLIYRSSNLHTIGIIDIPNKIHPIEYKTNGKSSVLLTF